MPKRFPKDTGFSRCDVYTNDIILGEAPRFSVGEMSLVSIGFSLGRRQDASPARSPHILYYRGYLGTPATFKSEPMANLFSILWRFRVRELADRPNLAMG